MTLVMTLKDGTRYTLDREGYVLARSDGPAGWDYGKGWQIMGFKTRHNATRTVSIDAALNGANTGQGWVIDWDHGTWRMWGSPSGHRLASILAMVG